MRKYLFLIFLLPVSFLFSQFNINEASNANTRISDECRNRRGTFPSWSLLCKILQADQSKALPFVKL